MALIVRTLCESRPSRCAHYPMVDIAALRCFQFAMVSESFRFVYKGIHNVDDVIGVPMTPVDTMYIQTGVWILASDRNPRKDYTHLVAHADLMCKSGKARRVILAETLENGGGTHANLNGSRLLNRQLEAAFANRQSRGCIHLLRMTWPTRTGFDHLRPDLVHPTQQAALSMAPYLWHWLTGLCVRPVSVDTFKHRPDDEWCTMNSVAMLH